MKVKWDSTISYPDVTLHLDGMDDTRHGMDGDAFNLTVVQDVRIYDRAFTQGEVAWLAGRRQPFYKPF